jgi:uncharacterized protein YqeY
MMLDTIRDASVAARKAKNTESAALLTTLLAEAARPGLDDGKRVSTDAEAVKVLKKFIDGATEMSEKLPAGPRREHALREKAVLEALLPEQPRQVTGDELGAVIDGIIATLADKSPKAMGLVMKELKAKLPGAHDGTEASALAKTKLAVAAAAVNEKQAA